MPYSKTTERVKVSVPTTTNVGLKLGPMPQLNIQGLTELFGPLAKAAMSSETEASNRLYGGPGVQGTAGALESAVNQPLNLPALPVPKPSPAGADFVGRLGANLASVMTGNGGFAGAMEQTIQKERDERNAAINQNVMMARDAAVRSRGEHLQMLYEQYGQAADNLRAAKQFSQSVQMTQLQQKVAAELAKYGNEIDAYNTRVKGLFDLAQQYVAKGFVVDMTTGTVDSASIFGGTKGADFWETKDAENAVKELDQLANDPRFKLSEKAQIDMTTRKLNILAIPRKGEDFRSIVERLMSDLPVNRYGYNKKPIAPAAKEAVVVASAIQYSGLVPGAKEWLEAHNIAVQEAQAKAAEEAAAKAKKKTKAKPSELPPEVEAVFEGMREKVMELWKTGPGK